MIIINPYGSKERLFEMMEKVNKVDLDNEKRLRILNDLFDYALEKLNLLDNPPTINIDFDSDDAQKNKSFANYNPHTNHINVCGKNRNLADIGRSGVHEIKHHEQNLNGVLNSESGKDGSEHENEANAFAGLILREYGKINPNIFE